VVLLEDCWITLLLLLLRVEGSKVVVVELFVLGGVDVGIPLLLAIGTLLLLLKEGRGEDSISEGATAKGSAVFIVVSFVGIIILQ